MSADQAPIPPVSGRDYAQGERSTPDRRADPIYHPKTIPEALKALVRMLVGPAPEPTLPFTNDQIPFSWPDKRYPLGSADIMGAHARLFGLGARMDPPMQNLGGGAVSPQDRGLEDYMSTDEVALGWTPKAPNWGKDIRLPRERKRY